MSITENMYFCCTWRSTCGPQPRFDADIMLSFDIQKDNAPTGAVIRLLLSRGSARDVAETILEQLNRQPRTRSDQSERSSGKPILEGSPADGQVEYPPTKSSSAETGEG